MSSKSRNMTAEAGKSRHEEQSSGAEMQDRPIVARMGRVRCMDLIERRLAVGLILRRQHVLQPQGVRLLAHALGVQRVDEEHPLL